MLCLSVVLFLWSAKNLIWVKRRVELTGKIGGQGDGDEEALLGEDAATPAPPTNVTFASLVDLTLGERAAKAVKAMVRWSEAHGARSEATATIPPTVITNDFPTIAFALASLTKDHAPAVRDRADVFYIHIHQFIFRRTADPPQLHSARCDRANTTELDQVRMDEERKDSSITPTTLITNILPFVASLLAPLFASLIAGTFRPFPPPTCSPTA